MVTRIPVVVVGAGHAGLGVSRVLTEHGVDHVVLERGEVANTWKTERWDSLRLLTPNSLTRLPGGFAYDGDDPDGFMPIPELIGWIERYAAKVDVPVQTRTTVTSVTAKAGGGYTVATERDGEPGGWEAQAVVLASGGFNVARIPEVGAGIPASIAQVTAHGYKRPDQLGPGRVLVVGASATGLQLADELLRSGREVTVAVGEHVRMPRRYRGRDAFHWLGELGRLDERFDEVDDLVRARHVPSPQLVGTSDAAGLDLNTLSNRGATLVGRLAGLRDGTALFSGSLRNVCALADLKQARLLDGVDEWVAAHEGDRSAAERPEPTRIDGDPRTSIDMVAEGYDTVLWATGFRADYSWLQVPVLDRKGEIRHDGGVVTTAPGLYRIGTNFLRRRKSSFIFGLEDDAVDLVDHLVTVTSGV